MSQCAAFDTGKRTGIIRTLRRHCESENFCTGSPDSCKYFPVDLISPVIADDPQDAVQDAALAEIRGQATLAAIAAISSK